MKKSPYKRRTKKKKGCPEGHSMQPTGEKDKKTGKDIMKCQLNREADRPGKERDPGKQTEPTKAPSRPAAKM